MSKRKDAKLVYAQSSDIKARSYIEYRKDMKKKYVRVNEKAKLREQLKKMDFQEVNKMYYTTPNIYYIRTDSQTVYFIKAEDNDNYFTSPYKGLILLKIKDSLNKDGCKRRCEV